MEKVLSPQDIVQNYDLFLVDVWGVVRQGTVIYLEAVKNLNWISTQKPLYFVSNSPRLRSGLTEKLHECNIDILPGRVYTSGEIAVSMILDSEAALGIKNHSVYHLTDDTFANIYEQTPISFTKDIDKANIILVSAQIPGNEDSTKYDQLLNYAASLGIVCVCPNPDTIIPTEKGHTYCPGHIVRNYSGKVIHTGKPHRAIYRELLTKYSHIPKNRILMIGDTIETDILGAYNVGIHSALVPTGNAGVLMKKLRIAQEDFGLIRKQIETQPSILLSLEL